MDGINMTLYGIQLQAIVNTAVNFSSQRVEIASLYKWLLCFQQWLWLMKRVESFWIEKLWKLQKLRQIIIQNNS
jgi:hypothetical protein